MLTRNLVLQISRQPTVDTFKSILNWTEIFHFSSVQFNQKLGYCSLNLVRLTQQLYKIIWNFHSFYFILGAAIELIIESSSPATLLSNFMELIWHSGDSVFRTVIKLMLVFSSFVNGLLEREASISNGRPCKTESVLRCDSLMAGFRTAS